MYSLVPGKTVYHNGKPYVIEKVLGLDGIICRDEEGKIILIDPRDLDEPKKKSVSPVPEEKIDENLRKIAKKRLEIIEPLLKNRSRREVEKRAKEYGYSVQTLYNWINAYVESDRNLFSLVPRYGERGGKGKARISPEQKEVLDSVILERYLKDQKLNAKRIERETNALLTEKGLPPISYNTVRRAIEGLDATERRKKREGRSIYLNNFKPSPGSLEVSRPLEIVQIDHTQLDLQIVDERHRKPIGRPYLTVALDVYSRCVYGFFVTLEPPSLYSVGQTLHMGLLPKEEYLEKLGVKGEWKIYGVPDTIHVDNAKEFRSRGLKTFCETFGITLEYRPRGLPYFGGHVERFMRTINVQIHSLSGTTFSNPKERGEYDSEGKAVFTLKEVEKYIAEWIVNVYHETPHSGIDGMTPKEKFRSGIEGENGLAVPIRILSSLEEKRLAKIALLPFEERKITKTGVSLFNLRFYDESLAPLMAKEKKGKYLFRYDPKDLNQIYLFHPMINEFVEIPNVKKMFPPPKKWEIEAVSKETRKMRQREKTSETVYEAILRLRKMEEAAAKKTKSARRNVQRREADKGGETKNETVFTKKPKIKKFEIDFEDEE